SPRKNKRQGTVAFNFGKHFRIKSRLSTVVLNGGKKQLSCAVTLALFNPFFKKKRNRNASSANVYLASAIGMQEIIYRQNQGLPAKARAYFLQKFRPFNGCAINTDFV